MPPLAKPGRRLAIEAALTQEDRATLAAACRLFMVPPDRWQAVPPVAQVFETMAAARLIERLRIEEGRSEEDARNEVAARLGLSPDTIRTRLRRWPYDAALWVHNEPNALPRAA